MGVFAEAQEVAGEEVVGGVGDGQRFARPKTRVVAIGVVEGCMVGGAAPVAEEKMVL